MMGKAQQMSVPPDANKVSQLRPVCFRTTSLLVIANFLYSNALPLNQAYNLELTPGQGFFGEKEKIFLDCSE
jgi:hypothetical protein